MDKINKTKGITLIALVITILVLLILAGISVNVFFQNGGILNKAQSAKIENEKASIKEQIRLAIQNIRSDYATSGVEFNIDELKDKLPSELSDISVEKIEYSLSGDYGGYTYTITSNYDVIIGDVVSGVIPTITYTLSTTNVGVDQVEINVTASVSRGSIVSIEKPDNIVVTNANQAKYIVSQNGSYEFTATTDTGRKNTCVIKVNNIKPITPIINVVGEYPTLTTSGVNNYDKSVTITYDESDKVINYYSEDGGSTWKIYQGKFSPSSTSIIAKTVWNNRSDIYSQTTRNISNVANISNSSYDLDDITYFSCPTGGNFDYYIQVDSSMINRYIRIYQFVWGNTNFGATIKFEDSNKNIISTYSGVGTTDQNYLIPSNTKWLDFYIVNMSVSDGYSWKLYDIRPIIGTSPVIAADNYYNLISSSGMGVQDEKVTITYSSDSTQKLYKIGSNGSWQVYEDTPVYLGIGTLYAKGINDVGIESKVVSINGSDLISKYQIGTNAYDLNDTTYFSCPSTGNFDYYIKVDSSMIGKNIRIKQYVWGNSNYWNNIIFTDINKNTITYYGGSRDTNQNYLVPANTVWIRFQVGNLQMSDSYSWRLYTISPVN